MFYGEGNALSTFVRPQGYTQYVFLTIRLFVKHFTFHTRSVTISFPKRELTSVVLKVFPESSDSFNHVDEKIFCPPNDKNNY